MKKLTLATIISTTIWMLPNTPAYSNNLMQIYQEAKRSDMQLKAQETAYLATLENKPQILAAKKPQINFATGAALNQRYTFSDGTISGGSARGDSIDVNYSVSVNKSVYNRQLDARIDKVDAQIIQARLQLDNQRQSLMMRVVQPYFDYLIAKENLQVANTEKAAVQRQLQQVQAFFDAGRSAITDVREAESRYNLSLAREVSSHQALDRARESLRAITGQVYNDLPGAPANLPLNMPEPRNVDSWIAMAKNASKSLQVARQAIDVAQKEIEIQRRGERNPVVNVYARHTGSITESSTSALDPRTIGASVGVEMNMPLYEGGAAPSRLRQAQHQFRQAQQEYEYQERLIEQQVRSAYLAIESTISQVQAQQKALTSAQTAAQATQVGFEVGTRTAVDVLTALRDVFAARRDHTNARYQYLLSTLQLRQAAGTLSENDLQAMSTLFSQR